MSILRHYQSRNFTIIPNAIFSDSNLNLRDIGLLCYLLHLPDNWNFSIAGLVSILANDGRDGVMRSLNRIEAAGYLRRERARDHGRLGEAIWTISDAPMSDFATYDSSTYEEPRQINTNYNKELKEINGEEKRGKVLPDERQELDDLPPAENSAYAPVYSEGKVTTKKAEQTFGAEAVADATALVDCYIDDYYPRYRGKKHVPVARRSRIAYAYRLLTCAAELHQADLGLVANALITAVKNEKAYDPTIFLETRPKTLGIWMIESGDMSYDLIRGSRYDFGMDGDHTRIIDPAKAAKFRKEYHPLAAG